VLRPFEVQPVLNGYIVRIGCKTLIFASIEALVSTIDKYLREPDAVEENYLKNSINSKYQPEEVRPGWTEPTQCANPMPSGLSAVQYNDGRVSPGTLVPSDNF
jgi:hypothetical protein